MKVCKYCDRRLTKDYLYCPGCGSESFKELKGNEEYTITTPPPEGYKIDTSYYLEKIENNNEKSVFAEGILIIFCVLGILIGGPLALFDLLPIIIGSLIGTVATKKGARDAKNSIDDMFYLSHNGVLIKNLPYTIVKDYKTQNRHTITLYRIAVDYVDKDGNTHRLVSEPKTSNRLHDADGKADLLINPQNYHCYYIDVDIY